ncbi:gypsy type transposase, partial [Tanacetum coccineum]
QNPFHLKHAKKAQPTLCDGEELLKTHHVLVNVPSSEEELELAEATRNKLAMKSVFENLEAEVDQNKVDLLSGEIEQKNLLITNENLIAECLSKDVFYTATDSVLNVSRFFDMHDAFTIAQKLRAKTTDQNKLFVILQEIENLKLHNKILPKFDPIPESKPRSAGPGRYLIDVENPIPPRPRRIGNAFNDISNTLRKIRNTRGTRRGEAKVKDHLISLLHLLPLQPKHDSELLKMNTPPKVLPTKQWKPTGRLLPVSKTCLSLGCTDRSLVFRLRLLKTYDWRSLTNGAQNLVKEVVATACYTQNRSLIHTLHNKTPYELVHDKKPDLCFLRMIGALCYPTNDSEDLGKLKSKAYIGFFVGYVPNRKEYTIAENDFKDLYPSDFEDLYLLILQGHLNHLPPRDKKILSICRQHMDKEFGTKKRGLEFMHDYKVLDSSRAVVFRDKYGMHMIMRFKKIHKFSDGTLQQIDEALDYQVKEFKVNKAKLPEHESIVGVICKVTLTDIYTNSKKEKRVMRPSEIHKFCDATLRRTLEGLKSYYNDVKYGYVQKELTNDEVEFLKLFVEEIEDRLNYRDQMRRWEIVGNHTKAYQIFADMLKKFDRDDMVKLWILGLKKGRIFRKKGFSSFYYWLKKLPLLKIKENSCPATAACSLPLPNRNGITNSLGELFHDYSGNREQRANGQSCPATAACSLPLPDRNMPKKEKKNKTLAQVINLQVIVASKGITSLKCVLTQEHLDAICAKYFVPEEVHPQLPSSDATMHERPTGKVGMYTRFFDYANYHRAPAPSEYNMEHINTLIAQASPFLRFPEEFLCWVGISRNYLLNKDTYPRFEYEDKEEMDLNAFIPPLISTARRGICDRPRSLNMIDLLHSGQTSHRDPTSDLVWFVPLESCRCWRGNLLEMQPHAFKKKRVIYDSEGLPVASHPPKRLRADYGTTGGSVTKGKILQVFLTVAPRIPRLTIRTGVPALLPYPYYFFRIASPLVEGRRPYRHRAKSADPEVDSLVRSAAPVMTEATTVATIAITVAIPADVSLRRKSIPEWTVTKGFELNDGRMCANMIDHFTPPAFFKTVRGMEHEQLFTEFNVSQADAKEESAEVTQLRAQVSGLEATENSLRGEVASAKDHNVLLEQECNSLKLKVTGLESTIAEKRSELSDLGSVHELEISSADLCWPRLMPISPGVVCAFKRVFIRTSTPLGANENGYKLIGLKSSCGWDYRRELSHGQAGRCLTDLEAYIPSAEDDFNSAIRDLRDLNFLLLHDLSNKKDASTWDIIDLLRLDDVVAKTLEDYDNPDSVDVVPENATLGSESEGKIDASAGGGLTLSQLDDEARDAVL